MKKIFLFIFTSFFSSHSFSQSFISIDSTGMRLKQFYLNQHVENLWIAGHHINWETGAADMPEANKSIKTHCSAFVASVCKQLDIYILRPPEHGQGLLANVQYQWIFSAKAFDEGWRQIKQNTLITAQKLADSGIVVVAIAKNPIASKPGHIALVMPTDITIDSLNNEGPTLIQAGTINHNAIPLRTGFKHHISGWPPTETEIVFFYNINPFK